eukprot:TRINITY_DN85413_c0_g1_i2.p1 TRINITY_DN85413_c0_g1~~TRINITY_DN85413_c0_g1_i2.p1  ORF type:complete len:251 (-),score=13.52 TRINITY_DN85413_c0_g1_i2:395-1147(-)
MQSTKELVQESSNGGGSDKKKQKKGKYEIARKLWHMSHGVSILITYWVGGKQSIGFWVLTVLGIVYFLVELYRVRHPEGELNKLICRTFGGIMRPHEFRNTNGITYYIAGVCLALGLFPVDVAVLSVLHLAICDPMASFVGRKYGKYTYRYSNGRTVAGTSGSFFSGCILTYFFYSLVAPNSGRLNESYYQPGIDNVFSVWFVSLLSGLGACVGESISIGEIDDNLILPLVTGIWLYFVIYVGKLLQFGI